MPIFARAVAPAVAIIVVGACASTPQPRQVRQLALSDTTALPLVVRQTDDAGISGVVYAEHRKPVPWAYDGPTGTKLEAFADKHGRFSMMLASGVYVLRAHRIGYHARRDFVRVPAEGGLYLEILVRQNLLRLAPTSSSPVGR